MICFLIDALRRIKKGDRRMRRGWEKGFAWILCLLMILQLTTIPAFADSKDIGETNPQQTQQPEEKTDGYVSDKLKMEDLKGDETADKLQPVPVSGTDGPDGAEKVPETDPYVRIAEPASDKASESVVLMNVEKKSAEVQMPEEDIRAIVYNGTMQLGYNTLEITAGGDSRYLTFSPATSGTYRFYSMGNDDVMGFLRDSSKNVITYNDDGGYGRNFLIEFSLTAGQTYYVGAKYLDASTTGKIGVYAELKATGSDASQGSLNLTISTASSTLYRPFTPDVSGTYTIYSVSSEDTWCCFADSSGAVFAVSDDEGYSRNFKLSVSLTAGTKYLIGARYFDRSKTGTIVAFLERQVISSASLKMGLNYVSVSTAGTTVYTKFVAPYAGKYTFYSVQEYDAATLGDTLGFLGDSDKNVYYYSDDTGFGRCFRIIDSDLDAGETVYLGARFFGSSLTGSIPVMIDYGSVSSSALKSGYNLVSVTTAGGVTYYPFTPTVSGTYTVYTIDDIDSVGVLLDADQLGMLFDDDSGFEDNCQFRYALEAGTTYYIAPRFYDTTKTGAIRLFIELQDTSEDDLHLGKNVVYVGAGKTVYTKFTAPRDGEYWIYSVNMYDETPFHDSAAMLANEDRQVSRFDDDGGYDRCFRFVITDVRAGDVICVGIRFYDTSVSGPLSVFVDYPSVSPEPTYTDGMEDAEVTVPGQVRYIGYKPYDTGVYTVYSAVSTTYRINVDDYSDTIGTLLNKDQKAILYDDDSGRSGNFKFSYTLEAGKTYYIGLRFTDPSATGVIYYSIEKQDFQSSELSLGKNLFSINIGGSTAYRKFVAPMDGTYWIYSAWDSDIKTPPDTYAVAADMSRDVFCFDQIPSNYFYLSVADLKQGDVMYVGVRYDRDKVETGTIPVFIDCATARTDELHVGENTVHISRPGETVVCRFNPDQSRDYKIYSTGSADTFGVLLNHKYDPPRIYEYNDDHDGDKNFLIDFHLYKEPYLVGVRFNDTTRTGDIRVIVEKQPLPAFGGEFKWAYGAVQYKNGTAYVIADGTPQTPEFILGEWGWENLEPIDPSLYTYEYKENTKPGTGYLFITFVDGYSGTLEKHFKIYLPATATTTVENVSNGIKLKWNKVNGAAGYVIYRRAWSSTTNGWTDFVRWNNTTALEWTDTNVYAGTRYQYGIKAYFARRLDPISNVWIGGNVGDNYNLGEVGPLKTTVRITTRTLNSVTAGSKQMTVKWTGSSVFTGYQIQYATNSAFTQNATAIKIADPKTVSTVIKNLISGKTYYVRLRSYHVFNGMTYFGEWSNVKSCKVK